MNFALILKRTRRTPRQLAALTLAICLVTAFFALAPLYVRAMVQAGLNEEFAALPSPDQTLTLIAPEPFAPAVWDETQTTLGALAADLVRIARSGAAFGGFVYQYGEPTTEFTGRSPFGNHAFAFSNLDSLVRIVEGRLPERLAPPDDPARQSADPQEQINRGIGMFSTGDVEAILSTEVARQTGYGVGTRFAIGERPELRVVVNVVGIFEATNPDEPIWDANRRALEGEIVQTGLTTEAFNLAFIVSEGAYSDWVASATVRQGRDNNSYVWMIGLNAAAVNADNITDTQNRLESLVAGLSADYAGLVSFNPLLKLLNRYVDVVARTEPPVILLAGAVLVLMLYHLVTTVSLSLEQQTEEWASLASRGGSPRQLVTMQALTMLILCLIAFLAGPPLASLILNLLFLGGPLLSATGGSVAIGGIPPVAWLLAGAASVAALAALTLPAIGAARRSLAQFKQLVARPPSRPAWARYHLDLICIVLGLGFLARLLFFIEGDLGSTLGLLARDPATLIRRVLDSANQAGGLADPLNLFGPALLLTGIALLWLRMFPGLVRLIGAPFRAARGLTAPLSFWTVQRDPGHYAQLVLLMIGTLALGTAALGLSATRDAGVWTAAVRNVGAPVRVDLDPFSVQIEATDWAGLPGVTGAVPVTRYEAETRAGTVQHVALGLDPATTAAAFPELATPLAPLNGAETSVQRSFSRQTRTVTETTYYPALVSARLAESEGRAFRPDQRPLQPGDTAFVEFAMQGNQTVRLYFRVVGVILDFPSLGADRSFLVLDRAMLVAAINSDLTRPLAAKALPNQVWLNQAVRTPDAALPPALSALPGLKGAVYAWDEYLNLLREPLPAAVAGMLFAGFWVSLALGLLDFGFYLAVTAKRRSLGFAVLGALGWNANRIWAQLVTEQTVLIAPALVVGALLGAVLAYLILPFLALVGGATLRIPLEGLLSLVGALVAGFAGLTLGAAWWLRHLNINRVLRLGEE